MEPIVLYLDHTKEHWAPIHNLYYYISNSNASHTSTSSVHRASMNTSLSLPSLVYRNNRLGAQIANLDLTNRGDTVALDMDTTNSNHCVTLMEEIVCQYCPQCCTSYTPTTSHSKNMNVCTHCVICPVCLCDCKIEYSNITRQQNKENENKESVPINSNDDCIEIELDMSTDCDVEKSNENHTDNRQITDCFGLELDVESNHPVCIYACSYCSYKSYYEHATVYMNPETNTAISSMIDIPAVTKSQMEHMHCTICAQNIQMYQQLGHTNVTSEKIQEDELELHGELWNLPVLIGCNPEDLYNKLKMLQHLESMNHAFGNENTTRHSIIDQLVQRYTHGENISANITPDSKTLNTKCGFDYQLPLMKPLLCKYTVRSIVNTRPSDTTNNSSISNKTLPLGSKNPLKAISTAAQGSLIIQPKATALEGDSSMKLQRGRWFYKDCSAIHKVPTVIVRFIDASEYGVRMIIDLLNPVEEKYKCIFSQHAHNKMYMDECFNKCVKYFPRQQLTPLTRPGRPGRSVPDGRCAGDIFGYEFDTHHVHGNGEEEEEWYFLQYECPSEALICELPGYVDMLLADSIPLESVDDAQISGMSDPFPPDLMTSDPKTHITHNKWSVMSNRNDIHNTRIMIELKGSDDDLENSESKSTQCDHTDSSNGVKIGVLNINMNLSTVNPNSTEVVDPGNSETMSLKSADYPLKFMFPIR